MFTVSLSATGSQAVSVNFATADGTATASADYTSTHGVLVFAPGETNKAVTVMVSGDTLDENDETFTVSLSNATNATIASAQAGGTIIDDDPPPSLSVSDGSVTEGNSGTVDLVLAVALSSPSGKAISVDFATSNGTATAGADYISTNGTLTFTAGETNKMITVIVSRDLEDETNEVFTVVLTAPVNAAVASGIGTGLITDDDDVIEPELADFGDAPEGTLEPNYPTTFARNGARHAIVPAGPRLGRLIDADPGTLQNHTATADDDAGDEDEDGISFPDRVMVGSPAQIVAVAAAAAKLDAWLDFNRDGDWDDPGEQILVSVNVAAGTNNVPFVVLPTAEQGISFARFRISTAGGLSDTGLASDGEVEDYRVALEGPLISLTPTSVTSLRLSWTADAPGYILLRTDSLSPPNWQPASGVNQVGNNHVLMVNTSTGSGYFKLEKAP
jgi:hypothetical protein